MDHKVAIDSLKWVRSSEVPRPPLREAGLEHPVFYAFQARAEWEMLNLAEIMGEQLKQEYGLHPAGQNGIGLNWRKLNERIWIPADYLEAISIHEDARSIFSHDESNCIGIFNNESPEDLELKHKVLRGPDGKGSSKAKIEALTTNPEWREHARAYSLRLLYHAGTRYKEFVKNEFKPVLEDLISAYQSEMRKIQTTK